MSKEASINSLLELDLEYKLTVAYRIDCDCAPYLISKRDILLPEIIKQAEEQNSDPVDIFAAFARGVHYRHTNTLMTLQPFD